MIPERAQGVIDLLRFMLQGWLDLGEDDQNWCRDTVKAIERYDFDEGGWACPVCAEVVCDGGCPLEPLRQPVAIR